MGATRRTSSLSIYCSLNSPVHAIANIKLATNLNFALGGHGTDGALDTYLTRVSDEYTATTHRLIVHGPCTVLLEFYIPPICNIHSDDKLATIGRVTPDEADLFNSVAQANNQLGVGCKRIRNEFRVPTR